jgi:hypothetical protein
MGKDTFREEVKIKVIGHIRITEGESLEEIRAGKGRLVMDKMNAIHPENFSIMIARGIANRDFGTVYTMHFGSGGATIDPLGVVSYADPNTVGVADLNDPVYFEVVDDSANAPPGNQMSVRHITGTLFSDVEIRCVLDKNQPFGQPISSGSGTINMNDSRFVFDEIALKTEDGLLVTHATFSPLEKAADRVFEVSYSLRIRVS